MKWLSQGRLGAVSSPEDIIGRIRDSMAGDFKELFRQMISARREMFSQLGVPSLFYYGDFIYFCEKPFSLSPS